MSKTSDQIKPNYAPVYAAALYPDWCKLFQKHGYALAVHGSLARDFDMVAIPWTDGAAEPETIIKELIGRWAFKTVGDPENKNHGRICYTVSCGFGECAVDLSFMPRTGK